MKKISFKSNLSYVFIVLALLVICVLTLFLLNPFTSLKKEQTEVDDYVIKNTESIVPSFKTKDEILKLNLMSAYGDNQGYHPKVITFDESWHGFKYWIAFTPYPEANQGKENPHILASNDMINWQLPYGYSNPLEGQPSEDSKNFYNSDTHLLYNEKEDRLECFWRYVDNVSKIVIIYRKYSYNGIDWSDKEVFLKQNRFKIDYLSPSIIIEDNKYKVWYVDRDFTLKYIERDLEEENWSEPRKIDLEYEDGQLENWHLDVIKTERGYEMLLSSFYRGGKRTTMNLYYTKSQDNITYDKVKTVLRPVKNSWINQGLYRSSILYYKNNYIIYCSGISTDGKRGVSIAFGDSITNLSWLTQNNISTFQNIIN